MILTVVLNMAAIGLLGFYMASVGARSKQTELYLYYMWMHLFAILVLAADLLLFAAPNALIRYTFILVSCIISLYFGISFFLFGYFYSKRKHIRAEFFILLLGLPLLCLLALSLCSPQASLFKVLMVSFMAVSFFLQFTGGLLIIRSMTGSGSKRLYTRVLMGVVFMAFASQFLISQLEPNMWVLINPVLASLIFTLVYVGILRFGMFETLSAGIWKSLEFYQEGVLVLNTKGEIQYANPFSRQLPREACQKAVDLCRDMIRQDKAWDQKEEDIRQEGLILTLMVRPLKNLFNQISGYVCVLHNDTQMKSVILDLQEKNRELLEMRKGFRKLEAQAGRLTVMEARHALAKEIHDVLGHSLNLALHTLESNKVILENDPEKAVMRLENALAEIDRGMGEVARAADKVGKNKEQSFRTLRDHLGDIARHLEEVHVKLELVGCDKIGDIPPDIVTCICRICQEACTNAIKHGGADTVALSIKQRKGFLDIHIVDNGSGCGQIVMGSGLSGMTERVEKLGGTIRFNAFEDEGFLINVAIPLHE